MVTYRAHAWHDMTFPTPIIWNCIKQSVTSPTHSTELDISDLPYPFLWVRHQWPPLPELSLRSQPSLPATRSIRLSTTIHSLLVRCTFTLSLLITWVLILFKIVKWGCSVHCIVCSMLVFIVYLKKLKKQSTFGYIKFINTVIQMYM